MKRRDFLSLTGASLAAASASGCNEQPTGGISSTELLATELRELNETAAIGVRPEDFELARTYVAGVFEEARLKLRPLVLREDLALPVHFKPKGTAQ